MRWRWTKVSIYCTAAQPDRPGHPQQDGAGADRRAGLGVVGSLNGGEVSAKLNREMALKVASDEAYSYLADVFWHDWDVTP